MGIGPFANIVKMNLKYLPFMITLLIGMLSNSLSAQKHIDDYNPQALFEEGVILFKNQQYGAAQSLFSPGA